MKRLLIFLASGLLSFVARADTVVYSNLGPGDTYDQNFGHAIGNIGGLRSQAMQFTVGASGNLVTIELGLTFGDNGPDLVNAFLYADASNSPDTATQIFLGSVTPTAQFQTTNNSIVSFNVSGTVPVVQGTPYWLALMPTNGDVQVWNQTSPVVPGLVATSVDNGQTWFPTADALSAFRITAAVSEVPEPGSAVWGLLGIAGLVFFSQRRITTRWR